MKAKILGCTVLTMILVLLVSRATGAQEAPVSLRQQAVVYFVKPVGIETILAEATTYGVEVVELRHSNHVLGQDIQGGYFPNPKIPPRRMRRIMNRLMFRL